MFLEAARALEVDDSESQDRVLALEQGVPVPVPDHRLSVDLRLAILGLPGLPLEETIVRPGTGLPVMVEKSHLRQRSRSELATLRLVMGCQIED